MNIGYLYAIIRSMKRKKVKLINDQPEVKEPKKLVTNNDIPIKEEEAQREKAGHRPSLLTPEMWKRLIALFEKHFFIASVASSANIYRSNIDRWRREQEPFNLAVTHARDKWLKFQMKKLDQYAQDKKDKDWRALKYKLSIADAEYNDKKFLKADEARKDIPRLTININYGDLKQSKEEATKIIGDNRNTTETVPLLLFDDNKKKPGEPKSK